MENEIEGIDLLAFLNKHTGKNYTVKTYEAEEKLQVSKLRKEYFKKKKAREAM